MVMVRKKSACDKARLAWDFKKTLYYNVGSISIPPFVSIFFNAMLD
jgi:hypothetical protein